MNYQKNQNLKQLVEYLPEYSEMQFLEIEIRVANPKNENENEK